MKKNMNSKPAHTTTHIALDTNRIKPQFHTVPDSLPLKKDGIFGLALLHSKNDYQISQKYDYQITDSVYAR